MARLRTHPENHLVARWLRAALLGANDGVVSTASPIVGVAAAAANRTDVLIAGITGLVAGAMSMTAGEYVSALGANARDELGISEITTAKPIHAALTSAATVSVGAPCVVGYPGVAGRVSLCQSSSLHP